MGDKSASAGRKAIEFVLLATTMTAAVSILFLGLPSSISLLLYGTVQFLWPLAGIYVLLVIRSTATDKNVRFFSSVFALALVPWTITLLLWEVILPELFNNATAYYISGFGFIISYIVIISGLLSLKRSKQWYIDSEVDRLLNVIAAMASIGIVAFVFAFLNPHSEHALDSIILIMYLVADVVILLLCAKLMHLNLGGDLRYLVLIVAEFVFINSIADVLYEIRWLFSMGYIFSLKTPRVTDVIYNFSLIFMVAALILYNSNVRKRAMEEINKKMMDTRHMIDNVILQAPDAMCVCDSRGDIVLTNEAMIRLFGMPRYDILGRFNIFDHMASNRELAPHVAGLKSGKLLLLHDIVYQQGNRKYHLSIKAFPTIDPDGKITGYVCIIDDITERLQIQKELTDSKRQAELYVDLMAHDINNMNQIAMGFLELAENTIHAEGKLETSHIGMLRKPIESLNNSSRLIDNVKKLQKEKSGMLLLRKMSIGEVLESVIGQFSNVPGRNVSIRYERSCDCSVMANDLLGEVFSNLVGNAVKHSADPLNVRIAFDAVDDGGKKYCRIIVEDDGPGIPDSIKKQIFDRFEPGGPPRGKGIGLYLVCTLVDDYGGSVSVEDRVPGDHARGSRFVVLLPAL